MSIRNQPTKAIDAEQETCDRCPSRCVLRIQPNAECFEPPEEMVESVKQLHLFSEEDYHRG